MARKRLPKRRASAAAAAPAPERVADTEQRQQPAAVGARRQPSAARCPAWKFSPAVSLAVGSEAARPQNFVAGL